MNEFERDYEMMNIPFATFREPDFEDRMTCVALGPGGEKLVSSAPLALRGVSSKAA